MEQSFKKYSLNSALNFFCKGTTYWRFDETVQHVELDYPRDMSMWGGIPANIDSVFKSFDGNTYFFKGQRYWEFDDRKMKIVNITTPTLENQSINVRWLKCPPREIISNPFKSEHASDVNNKGFIVVIDHFIYIYCHIFVITALTFMSSNVHLNVQ